MGVGDSTLQALSKPFTACCHDCSKYCLDDMEFDSNCSDCCRVHLRTHPHDESESEVEPPTP